MGYICFLNADLISFAVFRQRRGSLPLQGNQKVSPRTRSIKSAKTKIRIRIRIRIRIKSIRGTSTVIKSEVKIKIKIKIRIRRRRRIEVGIMILVLITQRNTTKRLVKSLL